METAGQRIDTPERRAGLESRLEARARQIADQKVQFQYLSTFRRRLREATADVRFGDRSAGRPGRQAGRGNSTAAPLPAAAGDAWRAGFDGLRRRDHQILLATVLNRPSILDDRAEVLGTLHFSDAALDKLRQEILLLYSAAPDLESDALKRQLRDRGYSDALGAILAPDVYVHAGFARSEAEALDAREGFDQVVYRLHEPERRAQLAEAERAYAEDPTEENWTRLRTSMLSAQHQSRTEAGVAATESRSTANDLKMMSS